MSDVPPPYAGAQNQQPPSSNPNYPPVSQFGGYTQADSHPEKHSQQPSNGMQYPQQPPQYQQQYAFPTNQAVGYGQQTQSTVVVSQPGYAAAAPIVYAVPPVNHAALAWLSCLFCFWPLGLAAIIKSNEVDSAVRRGDINGAHLASKSSRLFSLISIGLGIASYVIVTISIIVYVTTLSTTYNRYY